MSTEPSYALRDRTSHLLARVNQTVLDATPNETTVSPIYAVIITIYWRCLSRYEAIVLLLKHHHTDEALTVMRSLLNDAQRLIYLDRHPQKRNGTVMWLWNERLSNIESLANTAERTNQPGSQADVLDFVKDQRASLEGDKREFGVTKFLKPPKEGASMARELNRLDDWLDYLMMTHASHGTLSSPGLSLKSVGSGAKQISLRNTDLGLLLGVGEGAASYIFEAALSVASMLQWESKHVLQMMWNTIQPEFEALRQEVVGI
jgi:hypothetical protein